MAKPIKSKCNQMKELCKAHDCKLNPKDCGLECETTESLCHICTKEMCNENFLKEYLMGDMDADVVILTADKVSEIKYQHRRLKDDVAELRAKNENPKGIQQIIMKLLGLYKREGLGKIAKCVVYEEVMTICGIPFKPVKRRK